MKLNITELQHAEVSEAVEEYMKAHGTNHKAMLDSWNAEDTKKFGAELNLLVQCLAYELQRASPKKAIVKRLRGRISSVRHKAEVAEFDMFLNPMANFLL